MPKQKTVKIGKIELKLDGTTVDLSIEQAMELRDILNETFPETAIERCPITYPTYVDPWWERRSRPYRQWPTITWCGTSETTSGTLSLCASS